MNGLHAILLVLLILAVLVIIGVKAMNRWGSQPSSRSVLRETPRELTRRI